MIGVVSQARRLAPPAAPGLGRQWLFAGRPDRQRRLHAHRIEQPQRRDAGAESPVAAVAGVGQHDAPGHTVLYGGLDLGERDLRLGPELHVLGNMRLFSTLGVLRPVLGQIKPIGDRQAHDDWRSIASPRSDSCPSCRAARNTAVPRRSNANPSSETPCRRRSRLRPLRAPQTPAPQVREPSPASLHPTTPTALRSAATTDAPPPLAPETPSRRSARRSCARTASANRCSSPEKGPPDPRARARSPDCPRKPKTAPSKISKTYTQRICEMRLWLKYVTQ